MSWQTNFQHFELILWFLDYKHLIKVIIDRQNKYPIDNQLRTAHQIKIHIYYTLTDFSRSSLGLGPQSSPCRPIEWWC